MDHKGVTTCVSQSGSACRDEKRQNRNRAGNGLLSYNDFTSARPTTSGRW